MGFEAEYEAHLDAMPKKELIKLIISQREASKRDYETLANWMREALLARMFFVWNEMRQGFECWDSNYELVREYRELRNRR